MGEQNKPQEGKPLTAEEIEIDHLAFEFACISSEYKFGSDWHKNKVVASMRPYAEVAIKFKNGQTAALLEELEIYKVTELTWKGSEEFLNSQIKQWREELERWKDKYEVSVEAGKVTNTELEAVKKELQYKSENLTEALRQIEHYENRLEAVKKERDKYKNLFNQQPEPIEHAELRESLSEVTRQRDEAVKELEYARIIMPFHTGPEYIKWHEEFDKTISRLSSGETKPVQENEKGEFPCPVCESGTMYPLTNKPGHFCPYCKAEAIPAPPESNPVSPWISVDDRLPEQGQTVAFVVDLPGQYRHGQVYGGKFTGSDFATPGCGQPASHWMPLPAPPESLTDKKPKVKHDWIGRTNYCSRCGEYQTKYNKEDYCLTDKSKTNG